MISIFTDKSKTPTLAELKGALGDTYTAWNKIEEYTFRFYPEAKTEWNISSPKYGWNYRIKDKKRVLVYLLPRNKIFKVAMVFGNKAYEEILASAIDESIKTELKNAKVYAEGRGIRIEIKDVSLLDDIKKLVEIKVKY